MKRHVDESEKVVYFQGDYPSVLGIPHIMTQYPGYEAKVLNYQRFDELYGKKKSV